MPGRRVATIVVLIAALAVTVQFLRGNQTDDAPGVASVLDAAPAETVVLAEDWPGEDWPCFLGSTHDGVSRETELLESWPEGGPPLVWDVDVGTGYSAPSVLGDRLVLHHRLGDEEIIQCYDANTGEPLWDYSYPTNFEDPYGYNNGPRCSPILTADHCFTLGAEGKLTCVTLDSGDLVWQRDLLTDFDIPEGFFGVGSTPILEGDRLIVLVGGQPNSGVVAFAAANGATLWESVGQETWDGAPTGWTAEPNYEWQGDEMVVSYSSPVPASIHGQRHILCLMRQGLVSVDPADGHERFHFWFMSRTNESVNAACPVVVDDTVMISAAYRVGSACLKIGEDGGIAEVVWQNDRNLLTHWSTAHYLDGCYLGFSGRHEQEGALTCIDAATGEVKWATSGYGDDTNLRQRPTGEVYDAVTGETLTAWPFYGRGSAILADGKFIVLGERGTLALVAADTSEWQELARCAAPRMQYPSWTAPVLSRGRLYLRCEDALVCLSLRPQ